MLYGALLLIFARILPLKEQSELRTYDLLNYILAERFYYIWNGFLNVFGWGDVDSFYVPCTFFRCPLQKWCIKDWITYLSAIFTCVCPLKLQILLIIFPLQAIKTQIKLSRPTTDDTKFLYFLLPVIFALISQPFAWIIYTTFVSSKIKMHRSNLEFGPWRGSSPRSCWRIGSLVIIQQWNLCERRGDSIWAAIKNHIPRVNSFNSPFDTCSSATNGP